MTLPDRPVIRPEIANFARDNGISESGALAFAAALALLRTLPDKERLDVIAMIAKCHIEPDLRKVAFP